MEKEMVKWVNRSSLSPVNFLISEVLSVKQGEIHTTRLLDGWVDRWIDLLLLDFMLFDWDRVLRPGELLRIDKFFCNKTDLDDYMYMFAQFRYKKHKGVVSSKPKK